MRGPASSLTVPNNGEIGGIAKAGDVAFLELDLSINVVETDMDPPSFQ